MNPETAHKVTLWGGCAWQKKMRVLPLVMGKFLLILWKSWG